MSIPNYDRATCDALLASVPIVGFYAACRKLAVPSTSVARWRKAGAKLSEQIPESFLARWSHAMAAAIDEYGRLAIRRSDLRWKTKTRKNAANPFARFCETCRCQIVPGIGCVGCEAKRALAAAGRTAER